MIQAMIDFIAPLSVGETAAVALGAVAGLLILPPLVCGMIRAVREAAAEEREEFDPEWMDAERWEETAPAREARPLIKRAPARARRRGA